MSNDGGCPVILSEDVIPEVELRNECYVVCVIVGVAVFLSMTSQWTSVHFCSTEEKKKTPSSPLKMLNTDESDVNMPAVLCDLELIWALLWWRLQLPRRNKRFLFFTMGVFSLNLQKLGLSWVLTGPRFCSICLKNILNWMSKC